MLNDAMQDSHEKTATSKKNPAIGLMSPLSSDNSKRGLDKMKLTAMTAANDTALSPRSSLVDFSETMMTRKVTSMTRRKSKLLTN